MKRILKIKDHKTKLIDCCHTRWIQQIESLEVFEKLYTPIIFALAQIKDSEDGHWNGDSCVDAEGLWWSCISFEFIIMLVVVREGMPYIKPATVKLQREENDIVKVYNQVHILKTALKQARISVEQISTMPILTEQKNLARLWGLSPKSVECARNRLLDQIQGLMNLKNTIESH